MTKNGFLNPLRFSLEPALTLGPGPFHSGDRRLFGAIGDSAPGSWGRILIGRAERRRAGREGKTARTLREIDYLLMVDDEARQGALRFAAQDQADFFWLWTERIEFLEKLLEEKTGARRCTVGDISLRSIAKNGDDFIISCEVTGTARGGNSFAQPIEMVISERNHIDWCRAECVV